MAAVHGQSRECNSGNPCCRRKERYHNKLKRTGIDRETDQISPIKWESGLLGSSAGSSAFVCLNEIIKQLTYYVNMYYEFKRRMKSFLSGLLALTNSRSVE